LVDQENMRPMGQSVPVNQLIILIGFEFSQVLGPR